MSELQAYLLLAACLASSLLPRLCCRSGAVRRAAGYSALVLAAVAVLELLCVLALYFNTGKWVFQAYPARVRALYQEDPYLVGRLRAGVQVSRWGTTVTHNSSGFRGAEIPEKGDRLRIAAIGGSTTYGVGVSDGATWPVQLEGLSAGRFEVINFGIPSHSTVEHIVLAALHLARYAPDIALVHAGLNDLHVMHAPGLGDDYAPFHASALRGNLYLCHEDSVIQLGIVRVSVILLQRLGFYPRCAYYQIDRSAPVRADLDLRAAALYERNLHTLAAILRRFGATPIFIPQVVNREALAGIDYSWWTPFIEQSAVAEHVHNYNQVMRRVAEIEKLPYFGTVLDHQWSRADFVDSSHLNAGGNRMFAELVAAELAALCSNAQGETAELCRRLRG